jgi:hypothetical protein
LVAACHPTGVETISDLDVVATTHDATFNFAGATTYSLPTRVVVVGAPDAGIPDRIDPTTEQTILNTLKYQMDAQGYQQVQPTAQFPDLVMTAAVLAVTNITYYYGYWCGYWAYYYPCYPYYPPVVGVSTYTVGTLVVDLAKADAARTQLNGVWTAVIRGIQTGIKSEDQVRIVNGIGQAFIQSPYLGRP